MVTTIHSVLFNMSILYAAFLGIYSAWLAARYDVNPSDSSQDSNTEGSLSGNFWGSVMIYVGLNVVILVLSIGLSLSGYDLAEGENRQFIHFLYMLFIIVIMPGLFSMLRGRDDRNAAIYFSVLAFFNSAVAFSMFDRGLATWVAA